MSTRREHLIAASMLKQLLGDRVAEQVDPVKFWETELEFRLSPAWLGPIREIAQSLVEAVDRLTVGQGEDAQDCELLDAVPVRVNGGQVFHVDRKTGKRIAPEDEARAFREDAAALQVTRDLLTGKDEQLKNWMDDQSDDVRRAVIRALRVEQLKGQHPSNGEAR